MKKVFLLILTIFLIKNVSAMPAPRYLAIPSWKSCTSEIVRGDAVFVCLPEQQPFHCPSASWKLLQNQNLIDRCVQRPAV